MFKMNKVEIEWGGRTLTLETGQIARQADGAVLATYGETSVLCTVVGNREAKEGLDFFPLTVQYQEKTFAAGKIPGGFFKREGRPSEKEVLTSRLIDRPIRPLFADGFKNETQVICTVLSHDMENNPDVVAMIGASAALTISGLPFLGPIGCARVGYVDGSFVLNPLETIGDGSSLDLVVAGTIDGVLMVESEAHELSEDTMLDAVSFGHDGFQPVIKAIIQLAEKAAKDPWELPAAPAELEDLQKAVEKKATADLKKAYKITEKTERREKISAVKESVLEELGTEENKSLISGCFKEVEKNIVRKELLTTGNRIDGRDTKTVRNIQCDVEILPRAHGSALFTRGETQALVVTTLGTGQDEQIIDALEGEYRQNFLLHYNFPPFSVGETGRFGTPGRREIGHGKLAWRALRPLLPSKEEFPYTIRVVSEITESNGSSSMATVCGASLSMMDGGVPLKRPVAGIAMGLIKEGKDFVVLTDILGDEDHLGDMDFKVAGTDAGITALQMDIKITGITREIMEIALDQARDARLHILGEMNAVIDSSREGVSEFAPRYLMMKIDPDKIRDVIGKGGVVIRAIQEETGVKIDLDDIGNIKISATDSKAANEAKSRIDTIVADVEVNKVYDGKVVKLMDFGAFVNILPGKDGLVHISQISEERVEKVADYLNEGDVIKVKVLEVDRQGRIRLSMKAVSS